MRPQLFVACAALAFLHGFTLVGSSIADEPSADPNRLNEGIDEWTPPPAPALAPRPTSTAGQMTPAQQPAVQLPPPLLGELGADRMGPPERFWLNAGHSLIWIKDAPVPVPVAATDSLAVPGSQVLLGAGRVGYPEFNTLHLGGGFWLNPRHTVGVQLGGWMTENQSRFFSVSSGPDGSPLLVRPFTNPLLANLAFGQDGVLISSPGLYSGSLAMSSSARLASGEAGLVWNLADCEQWTVNFITGFRYFSLEETLTIYQQTSGLNNNLVPFFMSPGVESVMVTDRARTRNQFFGAQVGGDVEYRMGAGFLNVGTKVGMGPVNQVTEVIGHTVGPDGIGGPGGFLATGAQPNGNIGRTVTNRFSVLSDVNLMMGVYVNQRVKLGVGYDFLYLNNVARPGPQFSSVIDPRLVPTTSSFGGRIPGSTQFDGPGVPPAPTLDRDDFYAHGLRFLVEFNY